jgi:hypothetical protein
LVSGDLYDGDLLVSVVKQVESSTKDYQSINGALVKVCRSASEQQDFQYLGKDAELISEFAQSNLPRDL